MNKDTKTVIINSHSVSIVVTAPQELLAIFPTAFSFRSDGTIIYGNIIVSSEHISLQDGVNTVTIPWKTITITFIGSRATWHIKNEISTLGEWNIAIISTPIHLDSRS